MESKTKLKVGVKDVLLLTYSFIEAPMNFQRNGSSCKLQILTSFSGDDQGLEWSCYVEMGGKRRHLRHLPRRLRRLLPRLQAARGRLPPRLGTGMEMEFDETQIYF